MTGEKTHRVFFALWPDETLRQEMERRIKPVLKNHPAKKVPVHNWHITLAFLGNLNEKVYQCIQNQADKITGQPFQLQLSEFGYWKRPRVIWLGCKEIPGEITNLFNSLNQALEPCGYTPEFRKFAPHMTLLRKACKGLETKSIRPVVWSVNEFVLVESQITDKGSCYKVIRHWKL